MNDVEIAKVVEKVLEIVSAVDCAVDVVLIALYALLNKKLKKMGISSPVEAVAPSDPVPSEPVLSENEMREQKKSALRAELEASLETLFSDKADSDLSDEEKQQLAKISAFIEGGKK